MSVSPQTSETPALEPARKLIERLRRRDLYKIVGEQLLSSEVPLDRDGRRIWPVSEVFIAYFGSSGSSSVVGGLSAFGSLRPRLL